MLYQPDFIMVSLGADASSLKVAGLPTVIQITDPVQLFL